MKRWSVGAAVALCLGVTGVAQAAGPPTQLTVGDDARPLNVEGAPLFGWMPGSDRGNDVQTAYQLTVSKADGTAVYAGPHDMQLQVRIVAHAVPPERLRRLVQDAVGRSPVPSVLPNATPLTLHIDAGEPVDA